VVVRGEEEDFEEAQGEDQGEEDLRHEVVVERLEAALEEDAVEEGSKRFPRRQCNISIALYIHNPRQSLSHSFGFILSQV